MDSTQVAARQAAELANRVAPMTGYVTRLYERMQKRGWVGSDVLYEDVRRAQEALHRLNCTLREIERFQRAAAQDRRAWEPGGSGRQ